MMMFNVKSHKKRRGATRNQPVRKQKQPFGWASWLKTSFVITVMALVTGGFVWLQQDDALPIRHVMVEGKFLHVKREKLIKAVKPYVTGNFINVDVARLREAGNIDPWIKTIKVKRQWPDTLHLIIEERTAVAYWGKSGVIDSDGELFYPERKTIPKGLVYLQGPKNTHELVIARYREMKKSLAAVNLKIQTLKIDARRAWQVKLSNAVVIKLGRADSHQRLQRFVTVYKKGLSHFEKQIKTVDMRYTNGLAVSWKSGRPPELNGAV